MLVLFSLFSQFLKAVSNKIAEKQRRHVFLEFSKEMQAWMTVSQLVCEWDKEEL